MSFGERVRVCRRHRGAALWGWRGSRLLQAALLAGVLTGIGASVAAHADAPPRVDLNRASVEELMSLPGVGAVKAQAIVEHRRTAPFRKPEELLQVRGIGDSTYAGLRDRITVSAAAGEDSGSVAAESTAPAAD